MNVLAGPMILVEGGRPGLNGAKGDKGDTGAAGPAAGRWGLHGETIEDWDDALTNGFYIAFRAANGPTSNWYFGRVLALNADWLTQKVSQFTGSNQEVFREFTRHKNGGVWGPWVEDRNGPKYIAVALTSGAGTTIAAQQRFGFSSLSVNEGNGFTLGDAQAGGGNEIVVGNRGTYRISAFVYNQTANSVWFLDRNGIALRHVAAGTRIGQVQFGDVIAQLNAGDRLSIRSQGQANIFLAQQYTELSIEAIGG